MLFKSRIDAEDRSTQELIIFCHAHERVLLPLPKTYEEAQQVARNEFSLSGELVFETDDLHGFEGTLVRIHQAAWKGISPVIRSVTVKVANASSPATAGPPRPSESLSSGSRRLSSQKRMSVGGSAPIPRSGAPSTLAPAPRIVERQSVSARKTPVPTSLPKVSPHKDASPRGSPPSRHSAVPTPPPAKTDELQDDEEDEVRIVSPRKKSARPRVMSDYGVDQTETDELLDDTRNWKASGSDEEFDQLEDADFASAGPSMRSQTRPSKAPRTSGGSIVELDGPPAGWTDKAEGSSRARQLDAPRPEPPRVKTEKKEIKLEPALSRSEEPRPTQSQPKSDESFLIMIEYADDAESRTLFKTRARHAVSKVLMQACRTFGLEAYYRSARLVLVVEEENGEGEVVYRRQYACAKDETMGEAGAEPNARFLVEIVDDEAEDE
ncbi:hypothetical protein BD309DRAFT_1002612 [Dichomitus squalens]|nr:hypothetical protein BD309DRAFT_1002612 [Dichomitus squalens]